MLFGKTGIIIGRWAFYSQTIGAIFMAIGYISICKLFKNNFVKASILFTITLVISFLMITSTNANIDNPIYTKNTMSRLAFSDSELQSLNTISEYIQKVEIDKYGEYYFKYTKNKNVSIITPCLLSMNFSNCGDKTIIIRENIINNPFYDLGPLKIEYDPRIILKNEGFNLIYNSNAVYAFSKNN
ncbi:MAG: hypothetical protein WA130_04475 [Candidatus Methanoperedens sp.]